MNSDSPRLIEINAGSRKHGYIKYQFGIIIVQLQEHLTQFYQSQPFK